MAGKILNTGVNLLAEKFLETSTENKISQIMVGIGTGSASIFDTSLEIPVPISDGTVNDNGDNQLTGSLGGDNTTDNTTTFKQGAGENDDTSQNLIANSSNVLKKWTISDLSVNGNNIIGTQPVALWLYIKDSTTFTKFKTSGTALEIKLGSDSSNYYSLTKESSNLSVGWNWITSLSINVEDLTETGTVSGNIDTFIIEITTNNATDTFSTGDVVYDLLRQWQDSDLVKTFNSPATYNSFTKEINSFTTLNLLEANGFLISEILIRNSDATGWSRDTITPFSKSNTEELKFDQIDKFDNS
jgi:hypothetical protein